MTGVLILDKALEVLGLSKIMDAWYKMNLVGVLKQAAENNEFGQFVLQSKYGLSGDDIKYLWAEFPELRAGKKPSRQAITQKISELNEAIRNASVKMLQDVELWIFPKWRELIGAVFLGMFEGRPIKEITWSSVAVMIPSVKEIFRYRLLSGEECVGIFGIGVYACEFIPDRAQNPTSFSVPIHGVIMEMPAYERAIYSKKTLVVPRYSEYIREHLVRIPLSELLASRFAPRFFGPIIRKTSRMISEFLDAVKSFSIANVGLDDIMLLSAWRGAFNKFLVTENRLGTLSVDMLKGVPGVVGYEGVLGKLTELPMVHGLDVFVDKIKLLWKSCLLYTSPSPRDRG